MALSDSPSLPSSPPRQFSTFDMSSSPLPSLADLIQKKPGLVRSGTRATSIPDNATATFTTAISLLKGSTTSSQSIDTIRNFKLEVEEGTKGIYKTKDAAVKKPRKAAANETMVKKDKVATAPRKTAPTFKEAAGDGFAEGDTKPKKVPKPRAKKVVLGEDGEPVEKAAATRKPRVKKADKDPAMTDIPPKEKPARKSRAKKLEDGFQPKLAPGKVTKASSKSKTAVSTEKAVEDVAKVDPFADLAGFGLADAVRRRVNWTPPPYTTNTSLVTPSTTDTFGTLLASEASNLSGDSKQGFVNLLGKFGFTAIDEPAVRKPAAQIARKRKLIGLVKTNTPAAGAIPPVKEKAPKKKPKTITEQATSAYRGNEETELPATLTPPLQYFALDPAEATSDGVFKIPLKLRTRRPVKAQKSKKGTAQAPILLSPESALKQARDQDYVFGTSSQLAREDSPTLLRDLHAAMQLSAEADTIDRFWEELLEPDKQTKPTKISMTTNRNLWSAAARDAGGELMEVDKLDLAHSSPVIQRTSQYILDSTVPSENIQEDWHDIEALDISLPLEKQSQMTVAETQSKAIANVPPPKIILEDWHDIEAIDVSEKQPQTVAAENQSKLVIAVQLPEPEQEDWIDIEAMEVSLPAKKPSQLPLTEKRGPSETVINEMLSSPQGPAIAKRSSTKLLVAREADAMKKASPKPSAGAKSTRPKSSEMPDFSAYPTTKLEKEIKAYGFKSVKGRNPMIALMEQCWISKHGNVLGNLNTNAAMITPASSKPPPPSQAAAKSPGRPRGRPKKSAPLLSPTKEKNASRKKADNTVESSDMDSDTPLSQIRTPKKTSRKRKGPLEEIEDSDGLLTLSPLRRRGSQAITDPASLQLSGDNDADLSPDLLEKLLFMHITRAVKDAPPATNSHTPSWHEKILLYDPIVLEDLTVWLNTGALEKVGWDGEVEPKEVKKWCESKSICCLWKENLRGGARSRY